jgi:hypothetical protein
MYCRSYPPSLRGITFNDSGRANYGWVGGWTFEYECTSESFHVHGRTAAHELC